MRHNWTLFLAISSFCFPSVIFAQTTPSAQTAQGTQSAQTTPSTQGTQASLPTPVGKVVWVKGVLKALMENKEERVLQKESLIYLRDKLITDPVTTAEIVFTDKTLMTFKPSTTFSIDTYTFNPKVKKGSAGKSVMGLVEGGFRTVTGLIPKRNPNDYKVNTPVATIGLRGTDFVVYVRGGILQMGFYEGSPCVTSSNQTLCLGPKVPFAEVPAKGAPPIPLQTQPAVFREKLPITPASIAPFTTTQSTTTGGGKMVRSLCITTE